MSCLSVLCIVSAILASALVANADVISTDFPPVDGDGSQHDDFDAGRGHEFSHDGEHHDHDHNSRHHHGDHHKRPEDMNGDFDGKDSWRHDSGDLDEYGEGHDGHDGHDHDDHDGHKHGHGWLFLVGGGVCLLIVVGLIVTLGVVMYKYKKRTKKIDTGKSYKELQMV